MNTTADAAVLGGAIGAFIGVNLLLFIVAVSVFYILLVIAQWKVFTKAGEKGWKSLIPIYNLYITFKLFWETKWFWIYLGAVIVSNIILNLTNNGNDTSTGGLLLILLSLAAAILGLVVMIKLYNRISKSFGHGVGFTIGLIFLNSIFMLILGFNKDKYKKIKD